MTVVNAAACVRLHDSSANFPEAPEESVPTKYWALEVEPNTRAAISASLSAREKTKTSSRSPTKSDATRPMLVCVDVRTEARAEERRGGKWRRSRWTPNHSNRRTAAT